MPYWQKRLGEISPVPASNGSRCHSVVEDQYLAKTTNESYFRKVIEEEFTKLTQVGNNMRIRHSEVGKEPVGENGEKDYLFIRLFSLIHLALRKTGRLRETV